MDYVQIGENFAASLDYLERDFERRYWAALWADVKSEWVDDGE